MIREQVVIETKVVNSNDRCPDVQFEITPEVSEVGTVYTLHIHGESLIPFINYGTWAWQTADKFEAPGVINTAPTWVNAQTNGFTYTQTQPNKLVRVYFNIGDCEYYSNVSGFELPTSAGNGSDVSKDFAIVLNTETTAATATLFPSCSGTPTYTLQWYDPNAFSTISLNSSTGVLTYEFYPYNYLSNNSIVVERSCGGVIDILRLNYTIDYSRIQAINTYYEQCTNFPNTYTLNINDTTPQFLKFSGSTGNANMFTSVSGGTALRFDGIQGDTNLVRVIFEIHLSGNVTVPDDENFTIRYVYNGSPDTQNILVDTWRDKHSFAKNYVISMNINGTIAFDVTHSNLLSPGTIATVFNDVKLLIKPLGQAF